MEPNVRRNEYNQNGSDWAALFVNHNFTSFSRNPVDQRFDHYPCLPALEITRWTSRGPFESLAENIRIPLPTYLGKRAALRGKSGQPRCLTWKSDGDRLLCGLASGEVATYSATTLECDDLKRILAATGEITAMTALRRSDTLLFGDSAGKLHFSSKNFAPLKLLSIYNQANSVFALESNPTDSSVVVGVKAANPVLLDIQTHETVGVFSGLGFETSCLAYHPRQPLIAAGSRTAQLQLWDPRASDSVTSGAPPAYNNKSATHVAAAFAHRSAVNDIKWHPSRDFNFLSCGKDQLIYLWDVRRPRSGHAGDTSWTPIKIWKADQKAKEPELVLESHIELNHMSVEPQEPAAKAVNVPIHASSRRYADSTDTSRNHPLCLEWHPWAVDVFAVGQATGVLSIWKGDHCYARLDQTGNLTMSWNNTMSGVEAIKWHSNGAMLASTSGPVGGCNGAVLFWILPPKYSPMCEPFWSADS